VFTPRLANEFSTSLTILYDLWAACSPIFLESAKLKLVIEINVERSVSDSSNSVFYTELDYNSRHLIEFMTSSLATVVSY
jgi:hypothetical protein